ncbi:MAG TPA: tyrosine-type recombinase/integrase [Burkholderiaceae bacterium]|nr:tyrosine-type recombinase/integrase [Burkholderiaceae bacterium]
MKSLRESIDEYIAMRRGLGFKLRDDATALADFATFMEQHETDRITTHLALAWAQAPQTVKPAVWATRLRFVRGFARHHIAVDPRTEIPPADLLPHRPKRACPYLYSQDEVQQLLECALNLAPQTGLRPWTYHCLLGLLAVAGLRLGEVFRLRRDDVDLNEGVLTVRGTKFGKSRLVPVDPSTCEVLARYRERRDRFRAGRRSDFFLINERGNHLDAGEVHRTFYVLSRQVGLRGPSASHGPRLHDFRHRFAVETLRRWYRNGEDINRRMLVLSTYLGHVHIDDTYWYLSAHPELMGTAVVRLEQRWKE